MSFNARGAWAIYIYELSRAWRTFGQTILAPVLTTTLYFVVFGGAIGGRIEEVGGVPYAAFIIPGLLLLTLLAETTLNASFGIYMPRFTGSVFEILSAPVGVAETLIGFVGAAASKSLLIGGIILGTASLFVDYSIAHPFWAICFIILTACAFALFGFILGIWADSFERLQAIPLLVLQPLAFLGGTFYSIDMLGEPWRSIAMLNPIVYLVNGLRWTFYGKADVGIELAVGLTLLFLALCVAALAWIFQTGWKLRS